MDLDRIIYTCYIWYGFEEYYSFNFNLIILQNRGFVKVIIKHILLKFIPVQHNMVDIKRRAILKCIGIIINRTILGFQKIASSEAL